MPDGTRIVHSGPAAAERMAWAPCEVVPRRITLSAGLPLIDAMAAATGGAPAWIDLSGLAAERLAFVRPAPAPGDGHAAWYSDATVLEPAEIRVAGAHLGRDGASPFAHVHGIWTGEDETEEMGHLLPRETVLAGAAEVPALILSGAHLERISDCETQFSLFRPAGGRAGNAALATIRPNEDLHAALTEIARAAGMDRARVLGLGSLVGTAFADGARIDAYATEVLLTASHVRPCSAELAAEAVGFDGSRGSGRLERGKSSVCVTFECLLLAE